jgi:S1-C subfamily serine protease
MTTNHVVTALDKYEDFDFMLGPYTVTTKNITFQVSFLDGKVCDASIVSRDRASDIAIIEADCVAGTVAELADSTPKVGAAVHRAAYTPITYSLS